VTRGGVNFNLSTAVIEVPWQDAAWVQIKNVILMNMYRVAQKNGASVFYCKYFENSTTELRESW